MSRKAVELLTESLEPSDRALVEVSEEKAISLVRRCRCSVLEIPETAQPDDFVHITPGTVTAFVAREADPLLLALTAAIEAKNSREFVGGSSALASNPDAVLEREDFQRVLKSLPPEMTAAELLHLRADLLRQKPGR